MNERNAIQIATQALKSSKMLAVRFPHNWE